MRDEQGLGLPRRLNGVFFDVASQTGSPEGQISLKADKVLFAGNVPL